MCSIYKKAVFASSLCLLPLVSHASSITFDFTGRLVVADSIGGIIGPAYTPIAASLTFDTEAGIGSSDLSIQMNDFYLGAPATFHDISMTQIAGTSLIDGEVLVDWNGTNNMSMHVQWDATGLFDAMSDGLVAGDVLSGSVLYHDANGNGVQDAGEFTRNIASADPYSDSLQLDPASMQGTAPMAATSGSLGLAADTPFSGIRGYLDIGSGNSMHVTSVVSAVPVPAAVWLFGSGLIGLFAVAKRKTA